MDSLRKIWSRVQMLVFAVFPLLGFAKLSADTKGASSVVKIILSLFIVGALLPSAIVLVSNSTAYTGADDNVALVCYMVVPLTAAIAIALGYLKYTGKI